MCQIVAHKRETGDKKVIQGGVEGRIDSLKTVKELAFLLMGPPLVNGLGNFLESSCCIYSSFYY